MPDPVESLRLKLVSQVRGVFHDAAKGQTPTPPSDEALFARDTPIRLVHADIVGMMTGGVRALLLQMLHPHALQGVLDHSNFREDMHGRLQRTARFIAVTTFGHRDEAMRRSSASTASMRGSAARCPTAPATKRPIPARWHGST